MEKIMFDFLPPAFRSAAEEFILYVGEYTSGGTERLWLANIHKVMGFEGDPAEENQKAWDQVVGPLKARGLLDVGNTEMGMEDHVDGRVCGCNPVSLTGGGWETYTQLIESRPDDMPYGFLALSFNKPELKEMVSRIKSKIQETLGYKLVDLNDRARAGVIDNILRREIEGSAFLIADLTHDNNGVYWEAGFAEGQKKPVVYICEKSKFEKEKSHFDTSHCQTVTWQENKLDAFADELIAVLRRSIR